MIQNRPVPLRALLGASATAALVGGLAYPLAAQRAGRAAPPPRRDPTTASGFSLRQRDGLDIEARDYLGTRESEAAVQKGLKWLADNQSPDGSWPSGQDVGIVGLCSMGFLAAGHQPDRG